MTRSTTADSKEKVHRDGRTITKSGWAERRFGHGGGAVGWVEEGDVLRPTNIIDIEFSDDRLMVGN